MSKNAVRTIFAVAAATALMMSLISPAGAGHGEHENGKPVSSSSSNNGNGNGNSGNNGNGGDNNGGGGGGDNDLTKVCPGEHISGNQLASWGPVVADTGYYIEYCAKAGSGVNDNCGPRSVTGNESIVEVDRDDIQALCPGKQISHFSWWQVAKTNTSTPTTTTPEQESTTTTTQPVEEEVLDAVETAPTAVLAAGTPVFTG